MSTIESILTRAMNDNAFAEQLFDAANEALAGYNLSAEELAELRSMSRADFVTFAGASPEERKTFCLGCTWGPPVLNHNQTTLKVRKGIRWNHNETRLKSHRLGKPMSTIKVILGRMISEPDFADTVLTDAETALAEYGLSAEELEEFKALSLAYFDPVNTHPEERKSLSILRESLSGEGKKVTIDF